MVTWWANQGASAEAYVLPMMRYSIEYLQPDALGDSRWVDVPDRIREFILFALAAEHSAEMVKARHELLSAARQAAKERRMQQSE